MVASACSATPGPATGDGAVSQPTSEAPPVRESRMNGDPQWRNVKSHADDMTALSAYADASSIMPGDAVNLFVTTTADRYQVMAYRMGYYRGDGGRLVWRSDDQPGTQQTASGYDAATQMHYAKWDPSMRLTTTGWAPGMYLLRLVGSNHAEWLVPLVVRSPDVTGRLVFVIPDDTYQAYNEWGGRSAYTGPGGRPDRSRAVSFSRPYAYGRGAAKYLAEEQPAVRLAEQHDLPVAYVASTDIDNSTVDLTGADGLLTLGHDEYWTLERRRATTRARDDGIDLGFLGANTMYWRVRIEDGPQDLPKMTIYKAADEDPVHGPTTTARWRDDPDPEPERSLIGMDYECFPASGMFTVSDPKFFLFDGTGVSRGDTFPLVTGIEVDRAYPLPGTPDNLQIVADSPTTCADTQSVSTTTYYSAKSGAGVFATGSIAWIVRAMRTFPTGDPRHVPQQSATFVEQVTLNLWRAMLAGRMGQTHPAVGNIDDYDLARTNTTGTV
jgi:hypothetical protein